MKRRFVGLGLGLSLLFLLTGCDVEREVEKLLGAISQTFLELAYEQSDDSLLIELTNRIGRKIAQVSPRKNIPLKFSVINTGQANALALPNGHIYVFRGILEMMDTEDELAAVLGHESGHVSGRHSLKQLRLSVGISLLTDLLNLNKKGETLQTIAGAAATLYQLSYSRKQEGDADSYGLQLALMAGYDPKGSVELFEKFLQKEGKPSRWLVYLSTHPPSDKRLERAKKSYFDLGSIQAGVTAVAAQTLIADGYVKRGLYNHASHHYESALKLQPNHIPALLGLARAKEAWGKLDEAEQFYRKVLEQDPQNEQANQGIGRIKQLPKELPKKQTSEQAQQLQSQQLHKAFQNWQEICNQLQPRWQSVVKLTTDLTQRAKSLWINLNSVSSGRLPIAIHFGESRQRQQDFDRRVGNYLNTVKLMKKYREAEEACVKAIIAFQIATDEWEGLHEDIMQTAGLWLRSLTDWQSFETANLKNMQWVVDDSIRSVSVVQLASAASKEWGDELRQIERRIEEAILKLGGEINSLHRSDDFLYWSEIRLADAKTLALNAFDMASCLLKREKENKGMVEKALISAYRSRLTALAEKTPKNLTTLILSHHLIVSEETVDAVGKLTPDAGSTGIVIAFAKSRQTDPVAVAKRLSFSGEWLNDLFKDRPSSGIKVILKWTTTVWEREFDEEPLEKSEQKDKSDN